MPRDPDPAAPPGPPGSRRRVLLFARAPVVGHVKTRIAAEVGPDTALRVYRFLLATVFHQLATVPGVELWFTPADAADAFGPDVPAGWSRHPQTVGPLGVRLNHALTDVFGRGAGPVLVIGSDCPDLSRADLEGAWKALEQADVVLGPSTDGGYWLIGLKAPCPALFEGIAWSTPTVLAATVAKAQAAGRTVQRLGERTDIDTWRDWQSWCTNRHIDAS